MVTKILRALLVIGICISFYACSGGGGQSPTANGPAPNPPALSPADQTQIPIVETAATSIPETGTAAPAATSCPDGQTLIAGTCVANGSENAACLADDKCNDGLVCSNKVCFKDFDIVKLLPKKEDIPSLFPCGEYLLFNTPPPSPTASLASWIDSVLMISDAEAKTDLGLTYTDLREFTPQQIQNLLNMPLAESIIHLADEIKNPGFNKGTVVAQRTYSMIVETRDYLNYLSKPATDRGEGKNPRAYPQLMWGKVIYTSSGEQLNMSLYDYIENKIIIDYDLEKNLSMDAVGGAIIHEFSHWKDILTAEKISIAQTEANASLAQNIAYYYAAGETKKILTDWQPGGKPTTDFSPLSNYAFASKINELLHQNPIAAQILALFLNEKFIFDLDEILSSDYSGNGFDTVTRLHNLAMRGFELTNLDMWDPSSDHVSDLDITFGVDSWRMIAAKRPPLPTTDSDDPYKVLTGTSGSRTGWPIPIVSYEGIGDPDKVNSALIEVFHIPNGFSVEVQGIRWPNLDPQFDLGTELFVKGSDGKFQGNLGGVFSLGNYRPEAGVYLVKGVMMNLDLNRHFNPSEKLPNADRYILPRSQWYLLKADCGEDYHVPKDDKCFLSCQSEIDRHRNQGNLFNGCVGCDLNGGCGSARTFCGHYLGVPNRISCNASEANCNNRYYYRDGPIENLNKIPVYGTVDIKPISSTQFELTFIPSGALEDTRLGTTETYTLKGDGTWEGDLGGKIPLGRNGKKQPIPPAGIGFWSPDPNDPNIFQIQYGPSVTELSSQHPLSEYKNSKDDPYCDLPCGGPKSYECAMNGSCICED